MTLEAPYFDRLYAAAPDPWEFRSRPYEIRKRAVTLACLPALRYSTTFEPGCSIGVLTSDLASRERSGLVDGPLHTRSGVGARSPFRPMSSFDRDASLTIGLQNRSNSWSSPRWAITSTYGDCRRLGDLAAASASDLVVVHWRHPVDDYPLSGDEVHRILAETSSRAGMTRLAEHVERDFRLDVWSHDARSVACRTGVPISLRQDNERAIRRMGVVVPAHDEETRVRRSHRSPQSCRPGRVCFP